MRCDCSVDGCDFESFAFSDIEIRTARKPYKCCECKELINPGEKYEYVRGFSEGYFDTYRTCKTCLAIREDYCSGGWIYGELDQQLEECLGVGLRTSPEDIDLEDLGDAATERAVI